MTATLAEQGAPLLEARALAIGFDRPRRVLARDLNLTLRAGELTCLLGPNGVGKSTLLRTVSAAQAPLAGVVKLPTRADGKPLHELAQRTVAQHISVVLTERAPTGSLRVREMVELGRYPHTNWRGALDREDKRVVAWALEATGAGVFSERLLRELSDGERQRVYIARALAQEGEILLLDEPTAFLDLPSRIATLQMLRDLARSSRRAILLSTHDLDLALRSADSMWLMSADGTLATGAPEELVLSGAFAHVFARDTLRFDLESGGFEPVLAPLGTVRVVGEGVAAIWTARALTRAGWQIVENESAPTVTVMTRGDSQWWRAADSVYASLGEMLAAIQHDPSFARSQPVV